MTKNDSKFLTFEQENYICRLIDEWHQEWQNKIVVVSQPGVHRLGFAKEKLKLMICGDMGDVQNLR